MTRLSTQSPLSRGPDLPTGGRNISPGTFTPVANNSAAQILGLLSAAAGTISTVQNISNRRTAEEETRAWEMTNAELIRLREQADRDPNYESAFLNAYKSAQERFKGTDREADVESFGAPVVTQFQNRANRIAEASASGFFETRVIPQARQRIQESFDSFSAIQDPFERQLEIERTIREMTPPGLFSYLGDQADAALQDRVAREAMSVNNAIQSQVDREIAAQRQNSTDLALSSVTADVGRGNITVQEALTRFSDMNPADTRGNESRLVKDLAAMAESTRDFDQLATIASQFNEIVRSSEIQFPETKTNAYRSLEVTTKRMAQIDGDNIRSVWMNVYNDPNGPSDEAARVASANLAAEDYVLNRLSSPALYGPEALRGGPISNLPREGADGTLTFRGAYLETLQGILQDTAIELKNTMTSKDRSILANLQTGTGQEFTAGDLASANMVNHPLASSEVLERLGVHAAAAKYRDRPEEFFLEAGLVETRAAINAHSLPGSTGMLPVLRDRLLSNGPEFNWGVGFLQSIQSTELTAMLSAGGLNAAESAAILDAWSALRSDNTTPAQLRQAYAASLQKYNQSTIAEAQRVLDPKEAFKTIETYADAIKDNANAIFGATGEKIKIEAVTPSYLTQVGIRASSILRNSNLAKEDAVKLAVSQLRTQGFVEIVHGDGSLDMVFDPERQLPESHGLPRQRIISDLLSDGYKTTYEQTLVDRLGYSGSRFRDAVGSFILDNKLVDSTGLSAQTIGRELGKGLMLRFDSADTQDSSIGLVVEGVIQSADGTSRYIYTRLDTVESDGFARNIFRGANDAAIRQDMSILKDVYEAPPSIGGSTPTMRPSSLSPRREQELNTLSGPELLGTF